MKRLRRACTWPLRAYQRWLSPWKPAMCRFTPTCSQYAVEALETHGLVRGTWSTCWRLLRCQPLARGGYDPVPGGPSEAARAKHANCPAPAPCPWCEG
ncbi:MAG: membrane protein insertion efficiency factor YidD [Planctomycetes bacterium]|nr:membrane protein insertion efficiency factor YidD [Planctomycetota bacterium]